MGLIPPVEKDDYVPDNGFEATMEEILNREMYTYYLLPPFEKENIRRGFRLGFNFARIGYKSQGK